MSKVCPEFSDAGFSFNSFCLAFASVDSFVSSAIYVFPASLFRLMNLVHCPPAFVRQTFFNAQTLAALFFRVCDKYVYGKYVVT